MQPGYRKVTNSVASIGNSTGFMNQSNVVDLIEQMSTQEEFYEIEPAEVMKCHLNPKDKETFYDYLITNIKLYFDKFESELDPDIEEPTNNAYETAKDKGQNLDEPTQDELDLGLWNKNRAKCKKVLDTISESQYNWSVRKKPSKKKVYEI